MPRASLTPRDQQVNEIDPTTCGAALVAGSRIIGKVRASDAPGLFSSGGYGHQGRNRADNRASHPAQPGRFSIPLSTGDSEHGANRVTITGVYAAQRADANMDANI